MFTALKRLALVTGLGLAIGAGVAAAPHPVQAEEAGPATIAFVDVPRIMRDSAAAKSIRAQLERQEKAYGAEIKAQTDKLRQEEEALKKQAANTDAFRAKQQEFQGKVDALRQQVERRRQQMSFAQEDAMKKLTPVFKDIVSEVAKEVGASIVLDSAQVLVTSNNLNVTDTVLQRLDAKLPSVAVNFNAPATPVGGGSGGGAALPPPPGKPAK
ncbi:OmpH family outer membrane protein [Oleomonas cavernae]|uniref:OmpH family outer membrane protein n=1 Tax=Oleomonas cavernae TaxID=2320859 RepID=A0A418WA37_9PROT|nr:OmpH family outer membrane protein [Oleomonas cavernae]RJF86875.1 OmpH family outer membrane protein [Oleomonas cavernae]